MFIVFDLDGTLADDTHRQHHIVGEERDWDAYFAACEGDVPLWPTIGVLQMMVHCGHRVEIWTGRSESCRGQTERWLSRVLGLEIWPLMRAEGDHRPDTVVKGEWLDGCGASPPDLVFDDRSKSVAFWREQGITCYQVAQHDY